MFKDYYESNKAKHIAALDETLSLLAEAELTKEELLDKNVRLTVDGLKRFFEIPLKSAGKPLPSLATDFLFIDNKSDEGKDIISEAKSEGRYETIIAYSMKKSNFKETPDDKVLISKEFFIPFRTLTGTHASLSKEDVAVLSKYDGKENYQEATKEDAITLLKANQKIVPNAKLSVFYLQDLENETVYRIIVGSEREATTIGKMLTLEGEYVAGTKKKIGTATQENEIHTLLGFFYDAEDLKKKIELYQERNPDDATPWESEQFQSIIEPFGTAIASSNEFGKRIELIRESYKNWGYDTWEASLSYGIAATRFKKEVIKFSPVYIVSKSISEYRDLESSLLNYADRKIKRTTVDAVVSSVTAENLLKFMNLPSTTLHANVGEGTVSVMKNGETLAKYYQISLKTKKSDQLGRAQTSLSKKYKFANKAEEVYGESLSYETFINEGLISKLSDAAKNGLDVLKRLGKEHFDKLVKVVTSLKSWASKLINNIKTNTDKNILRYTTELYNMPLTEDVKSDVKQIVADIISSGQMIKKYKIANDKINKSFEAIKTSQYGKHYQVMYNIPNSVQVYDENLFYRQIFNYSFLESIKNLLLRSVDAKHMEEYVGELVDMYSDAIFGATELPLWKIYSVKELDSKETPWEYLGNKASNAESRKKNIIENYDDSLPLTVIKGTSVKGGYHHIYLYTLSRIVDSNGTFAPTYLEFVQSYDKNSLSPTFSGRAEVPGPITDKSDSE